MTFWSTALKWNHGFLKEAIQKTWLIKRWKKGNFSENFNKKSNKSKVVRFLLSLNSLSLIIIDNLNILPISREAKAVFSTGSMVSFRSALRISSYPMRTKLYPLERFVGSRQYKKSRCEVFKNVTETDTFSSTVPGDTFQKIISLIVTTSLWSIC